MNTLDYVIRHSVAYFTDAIDGELRDRRQPVRNWWEASFDIGLQFYANSNNTPLPVAVEARPRRRRM